MAGRIYRILAGDHARLDGILDRAMPEAGAIDRATYAEFHAGILKHFVWGKRPCSRPPNACEVASLSPWRRRFDSITARVSSTCY